MVASEAAGVTIRSLNRFAAAIVGGYLFTYGYAALATFLGFAAGLPFSDSRVLAWTTGPLIYLAAIVWAFVPRRTITAWLVLGGGGAAMGVAAWALSRTPA